MSGIERVKELLVNNKLEDWDIYTQKVREAEVHLRGREVESVRYPLENFGYTVRVIKERRGGVGLGLAPGNNFSTEGVTRTVNQALKNASLTRLDKYSLPSAGKYPRVEIKDPAILKDPVNVVLSKAEELRSSLQNDKKVEMTFCKLRTYEVETSICNSNGLAESKTETFFYLELALKAKAGGKVAEYWPDKYYRRAGDFKVESDVADWVKLVKDTLDSKLPPTKRMDVVFPPQIVSELLPSVLGYHASGQALYKRLSRFTPGVMVGDEALTVIDNGLYPYALNTSPFDDEGSPQQATLLIEKGLFENYIFDQFYGLMNGENSTGNGLKRASSIDQKYPAPISNSPTNIEIKPGRWGEEEIIGEVKEGILIRKFAWLDPDPLTSSFGSEIRNGYLIRNGEITGSVKGGQISGHVLDASLGNGEIEKGVLNNIFAVSRNQSMEGDAIVPTIGVRGVQVAGKNR